MFQQFFNQAISSLSFQSKEQLQDLLDDDDKCEEKINEVLKSLENEKDVIINSNRQMAESNLLKEPKLIELRSQMNDLSAEAKILVVSVQEKQAQIKSLSGNVNPDTTLALLQAAAAESEEASEKLSTDFLENSLSVEEFIQQFLKDRKMMHLRKLKAEKMVELLRQPRRMSSNLPTPHNNYVPQSNFYPSNSNVPYPAGPISMPMPGYPY